MRVPTLPTLQTRLAVLASLAAGGLAAATPAPQLMEQNRCYVCHADADAKAGPAFVDIAAAYRGNPKAAATVSALVRRGQHGGGPWNMPPHPEISAADADTITRYILGLPSPPAAGAPGSAAASP